LGRVATESAGTFVGRARQSLLQWLAVSQPSETACGRSVVDRCLRGPARVVRFRRVSAACARRQAATALREAHPLPQPTPWGCLVLGVVQPPLGMPDPGCGPTPWGCLVLGVVQPPVGAPVRASWPDRLGGVSRHPPGTAAGPPRPRLRQWVAVSAASETACRRAVVHLPACSATGGPAPPEKSGV